MSKQKQWITGDVEHGIADVGSNSPVKIGGFANAAEQAAVDESERAQIGVDLRGNQKIVGNIAHDTADRGDPVKVGGIARQANPTAVAALDRVNATFDDLGRQLTWPIQLRDLLATANASTSTLAEVTLYTGVAGEFADLLSITAANGTGSAVVLDIRDIAAGGIIASIRMPANETVTVPFNPPYPQSATGNNWSIQNGAGSGDISSTTINVAALFARNI